MIPAIDWNFRRTLDGRERTVVLNPEVAYTSAAGDTVMAELFHESDRLATGYAPVPGAWIAPGSYGWNYVYGVLETSQARPVWTAAELRAGGYYDGRRNDQTVTLGWKPHAHWGARVGIGRNAISLPTGSYTVRLATLRLDHTPNTRFAQSLVDTLDLLERVVLGVVRQCLRVVLQRRQRALPLLHIQHVGKRGRLQIREQPHRCRSGRSLAVVIQRFITG